MERLDIEPPPQRPPLVIKITGAEAERLHILFCQFEELEKDVVDPLIRRHPELLNLREILCEYDDEEL